MTSQDKIGKVASVAQSDKQKSALQFKVSQQDHRRNCDQLEQLKKFKQEYEAKLETMGGRGIAARQLQDYRQFLGKLNQAIEQQIQEMQSSQQQVEEAREHWLAKSRRSSALDQMVDHRLLQQRKAQDKAEQAESDEISLARSNNTPET